MTSAITRGAAACVAVAGLLALPQHAAADVSENRYHESEAAVSANVSERAEGGMAERSAHASENAAVLAVATATVGTPITTGPSYSPGVIKDIKPESGPTPNPEPATILLIGAGTAGVAYLKRRRAGSREDTTHH
jgi:hypothetical protein